jgi:hypothetical protein
MRVLAGFMAAALTAMIGSNAMAAGTFDGNWIGQVPPIGKCPQQSVMTITIADENLIGQVHNVGNVRTIKGTIDADGNATFAVLPNYRGTMKFTGDHFDGNWNNGACIRHVLGDRAPDAAKTAEFAAQRKQAQVLYDDLTAKAARGERSVDYAALRDSYPYTKQWDVFSNKTAPLMDQAKVAAKGGDCAAALEKLDEVLKIDYTVIVTHEMRSDCLKQANRRDESRIETGIADGLKKSLTSGGDGNTEKTAFPVMTMHEEMDVLADKHIVLKTRQTEVRASNGRFYDVVHGISLRNGKAEQHDVYFDVTTQVTARNSIIASSMQSPSGQ